MKVTFYGGTGSVTGANFLVENSGPAGDIKFVVDCGMMQGSRTAESFNRDPFPYDVSSLSYLLVTHAHIDHIGRIPKLVKDGFSGKIISTPETKEIAGLLLVDTLKIIEDEARKGGVLAMFEMKDVEKAMSLWQTLPYHTDLSLNNDLTMYLRDSGHILGSSMIEIRNAKGKIVFTGDLGNSPSLLLNDTEPITDANYIVMESVYGDRNHEPKDQRRAKLKQIILDTIKNKRTLIIPAFSLERSQMILYEMNEFFEKEGVPQIPVFMDSPLASKITKVYEKYTGSLKKEVQDQIKAGDDVFRFPRLKFTVMADESQRIDMTANPKIIIAGSGMSNGGRVIHHERDHVGDPNAMILLVGYQAVGTLGRQLQDGAKEVEIYGQKLKVRAKVDTIAGYSSHKDSDGLTAFVEKANEGGTLRQVFVVMGEPKSSLFLVQRLRDELDVKAINPEYKQSFELEV
jgi:metallo-beta-lactamase family protein